MPNRWPALFDDKLVRQPFGRLPDALQCFGQTDSDCHVSLESGRDLLERLELRVLHFELGILQFFGLRQDGRRRFQQLSQVSRAGCQGRRAGLKVCRSLNEPLRALIDRSKLRFHQRQ